MTFQPKSYAELAGWARGTCEQTANALEIYLCDVEMPEYVRVRINQLIASNRKVSNMKVKP